jgi:hypothetical protein
VSSGAMLIHTTINGIKNQCAILAIPTMNSINQFNHALAFIFITDLTSVCLGVLLA